MNGFDLLGIVILGSAAALSMLFVVITAFHDTKNEYFPKLGLSNIEKGCITITFMPFIPVALILFTIFTTFRALFKISKRIRVQIG